MNDRPASPRAFAIRLRLARCALLWERTWPALWPALTILGLFLVAALFGLLSLLPGLAHSAVLLGFGAAFLVALAAALRSLVVPDLAAARRRIERASRLPHRPLQTLVDQPSGPFDPLAAKLWEAHWWRTMLVARRLRVGLPVAGLAARDPRGLRVVLAIVLLLGAIDAGGDWRERLLRAVTPNLEAGASGVAASLDIWVTPPIYTGLPPVFLRSDTPQPIRIPIGSIVLAQVHGGETPPHLVIDRNSGSFETIDKSDFRARALLKSGKRIEVTQAGIVLGRWSIDITPDDPPTVSFARSPEPTLRKALRLEYKASDDYGVESVKAVIHREGGKPGDKIELDLPLPGLHLKAAHATAYQDLTAHPWAGLPVEIRLVAADALGQIGTSSPVRMKLPERVFHNPIAREIIEERKELAKDPKSHLAVAEILGDLQSRPALYGNDAVVFLTLRVAQDQLRLHGDTATSAEVEQLLWDTALRIEDGRASLAENQLRRIERQLRDALAKNAPDQEIDRLMNELRQALDRYLQALAENMARYPGNQQPIDRAQRILTSRDLERMLERARELAQSGDRERARELLSQLQEMLENLRLAQPRQRSQQGMNEAQQMMHGMRDLMRRQQQLLDRSFRSEQQQSEQGQMGMPGDQEDGQPGEGRPGTARGSGLGMGDAAGQQEALRHALGELMRRMGDGLGDIPDPLGRAERAMRDATGALRGNRPRDAIAPQTEALDQLQQAAREFAQQMQRRLGNRGQGDARDDSPGIGDHGDGVERDPLGRPVSNGGAFDEGDVRIPDNNTMQKARDILDELRRRAGERDRPQIELDYIDRLLERF